MWVDKLDPEPHVCSLIPFRSLVKMISYFSLSFFSDDFNRVKLQTDGKDGNDYINASNVRLSVAGEEQQLCYIACQGPLAATLGHFWQMVWEASTNVVTMVTQEVESEKVKCHKYWPQSADQPLEVCDGWVKRVVVGFVRDG